MSENINVINLWTLPKYLKVGVNNVENRRNVKKRGLGRDRKFVKITNRRRIMANILCHRKILNKRKASIKQRKGNSWI